MRDIICLITLNLIYFIELPKGYTYAFELLDLGSSYSQ